MCWLVCSLQCSHANAERTRAGSCLQNACCVKESRHLQDRSLGWCQYPSHNRNDDLYACTDFPASCDDACMSISIFLLVWGEVNLGIFTYIANCHEPIKVVIYGWAGAAT